MFAEVIFQVLIILLESRADIEKTVMLYFMPGQYGMQHACDT